MGNISFGAYYANKYRNRHGDPCAVKQYPVPKFDDEAERRFQKGKRLFETGNERDGLDCIFEAAEVHGGAMYFLAKYYWRRGDMAAAIKFMQGSAEKGHCEAFLDYGTWLRDGVDGSLDRDLIESVTWFNAAAETGNVTAMARLAGVLLLLKENDWSFHFMEKAAKLGHVEACLRVSWMYRDGCGCEQNPLRAEEWMKIYKMRIAEQLDVSMTK